MIGGDVNHWPTEAVCYVLCNVKNYNIDQSFVKIWVCKVMCNYNKEGLMINDGHCSLKDDLVQGRTYYKENSIRNTVLKLYSSFDRDTLSHSFLTTICSFLLILFLQQ